MQVSSKSKVLTWISSSRGTKYTRIANVINNKFVHYVLCKVELPAENVHSKRQPMVVFFARICTRTLETSKDLKMSRPYFFTWNQNFSLCDQEAFLHNTTWHTNHFRKSSWEESGYQFETPLSKACGLIHYSCVYPVVFVGFQDGCRITKWWIGIRKTV